tara:strand:+ start:578 stop:766 length:189 start_codon:yes stop_codon:yes gene_type:complete
LEEQIRRMVRTNKKIRNSTRTDGSKKDSGHQIADYGSQTERELFIGSTDAKTIKRLKKRVQK